MSGLTICSVDGCERVATRKLAGYCEMHYYRVRRNGTTDTIFKKRVCDESIFINPRPEACWLMGLIWSDGCISGNRVSVSSVDLDLLIQCVEVFGGVPGDVQKKGSNAFEIGYSSEKIANSLREFGLRERKSLTCRWPVGLPSSNQRHFFRGLFDGDGCAGLQLTRKSPDPALRLYLCTASALFAEDIQDVLRTNEIMVRSYVSNRVRSNPLWYITATNRQSIEDWAEWMYGDGGPCLHRKKQRIAGWLLNPRIPPGNPNFVGKEKRIYKPKGTWILRYKHS